ncbi:MAG TPA: hypothetical protein VEV81_15975, partial [Pyrinomonadaceae bacterium]|nr:hypothetical protein [Pyrinomonadaceae bacterium]
RLSQEEGGQGQALPLQNYWSQGFLFAALKLDGVNPVGQRRKKGHPRKRQQKAKAYGIKVSPDEGGASPPPPPPPPEASQQEFPTSAAPPPIQASPGTDASGAGGPSSPAKKSAPRIKPPTVMIKPPTE